MEISFVSHSCFKVKGKTATLVFDPYNPQSVSGKFPKMEADIVCVSHEHDDHNYVEGVKTADGSSPFIIRAPGEYEVKGAHIQGFSTFHDDKEGKDRGKNTLYYVELDGLFLLHLGDLGHMPSSETFEELERIDVVFVPVGGEYTIDHKLATEIVSELEPSIVIPMHFHQPGKITLPKKLEEVDLFIADWGKEVVKKDTKIKISGKADLPTETQIVVLDPM